MWFGAYTTAGPTSTRVCLVERIVAPHHAMRMQLIGGACIMTFDEFIAGLVARGWNAVGGMPSDLYYASRRYREVRVEFDDGRLWCTYIADDFIKDSGVDLVRYYDAKIRHAELRLP